MKKPALKKRRNPAEAAIEASEGFHGRPVRELVEVQISEHHHEHLWEVGKLRRLVVVTDDYENVLTGFGGAILCANEDRNQLYIVGGDQAVDLADYGITRPHETEVLGWIKSIRYFTTKYHLGPEGGKADYDHKFGETVKNGQHVMAKDAVLPQLIYHTRDQRLSIVGGSYSVPDEGIDR